LSDKFSIEILLCLPPYLVTHREELNAFIQNRAIELNSNIEMKFVDELSNKTQIVISIVREKIGEFDRAFYEKYQDNKLRFLFFYFQDVSIDIDDIDDEIYKRIEFKDEISPNINIYNEFDKIEDLKEKIELNLAKSISDILHRTNHSKINSSVLARSKGVKFYDHNSNLRKVDNFLRREKRISLINGLGGVGKTALAIEYAVQSLENEIYDYVIWLDVQNGIDKELQKFTISYLVSNTDDGKQGKEYYDRKFNDFIAEYPNSLVVLDNYENNQDELSRFLSHNERLDIIITSRETIPTLKIHPIALEVFQDIDDALGMFILNSTRVYLSDEKEVLKELIEHLGKLPLALEITANFLSDSGMDVKVYLSEFKKESLKLFDKLEDYKPQFHLENLRATLKINSKIIDNKNALDLLKIFALISPEPISKDIIENYLMDDLGISDFDRVLCLKELEKFSYIKKSNDNYSMHRLLQEAIRVEYFEDENSHQIALITKLSLAIFHWFVDELDNAKYGSYFDQTKEHIDFILERWKQLDIDEARVYLYTFISAYIENISEHKQDTLESIKKAIELVENIAIKNDEKVIVYSQYAKALTLNKKYFDAEKIYLDIVNLSENNVTLSNIYTSFASLYWNIKEYDKAIKYNNKSLELIKMTYDDNHPSVAITYNNLASIYTSQQEYIEAEEFYIKSLIIKNNHLEVNHPSTAMTYSNLGSLYYRWKKYPQSFKNFFLALKMKLTLELTPINIINIENNFHAINNTKTFLKLHNNQKISVNKQIDELNKLFVDKKLKYKLKKVK